MQDARPSDIAAETGRITDPQKRSEERARRIRELAAQIRVGLHFSNNGALRRTNDAIKAHSGAREGSKGARMAH